MKKKDKKNPNSSGGKPRIGSSRPFQDLAKRVVAFPELPDLQEEGLDMEALTRQGEVIRAKAKDVGEWTAGALAFLDSVGTLGREERELAAVPITKAQEGLEHLLKTEPMRAYRRAAWLAYLKYMLSRQFRSPEEIRTLFRSLVREDYLQESPNGPLRMNGVSYTVSPEAAFDDPEVQEIASLTAGLTERVLQAERAARRQRADEITSQATLSIEDFLAGKPGKLAIHVPPERFVQGENGVFWRGGGLLLVESDGETCLPLEASGGPKFEGAIEEAINLGVFLLVSSLQHNRPPSPQRLPDANRRKLQLLWHLLQRGIRAWEEEKKIRAVREELAAKATLTPAEFFLEGKPGVCLVGYDGIWHTPDEETIPHLFFLVERKVESDGEMIIRIIEAPDHLQGFFDPEPIGVEYPEEEQFKGIPYPLGAVLKAVYGQTQKATKIASE
jgi:hypothetical protein